jgi:hypothetical protein
VFSVSRGILEAPELEVGDEDMANLRQLPRDLEYHEHLRPSLDTAEGKANEQFVWSYAVRKKFSTPICLAQQRNYLNATIIIWKDIKA